MKRSPEDGLVAWRQIEDYQFERRIKKGSVVIRYLLELAAKRRQAPGKKAMTAVCACLDHGSRATPTSFASSTWAAMEPMGGLPTSS